MPRGLKIPAFPQPSLGQLLRPAGPFAAWLNHYTSLHGAGRDALYWAYRALGLPRGATVWLPPFHCGVEVQAALDAGLAPDFYRLSEGSPALEVDREDLERKLRRRPGPVVLIHYFGLAQSATRAVAALCGESGAALIEDCAHALFSLHEGAPLGSFGPLAIFSFPKTLALYDGGALAVDAARLRETTGRAPSLPPRGAWAWDPYRLFIKDGLGHFAGPGLTRLYRRLRWGAQEEDPDTRAAGPLDPEMESGRNHGRRMSALSRRLAASADPGQIILRRRRHWQALAAGLAETGGGQPLFATLPADACPLFFPLRAPRRAELRRRLLGQGIETFIFGARAHPALDAAAFGETRWMREEILGLPIHQDLGEVQIERMLEIIGGD